MSVSDVYSDVPTSNMQQILLMTHQEVDSLIKERSSALSQTDGPDFHNRSVAIADFMQYVNDPDPDHQGRKFYETLNTAVQGHDGGLLPITATKFPLDSAVVRYQTELNTRKSKLHDLRCETQMIYIAPTKDSIDTVTRTKV